MVDNEKMGSVDITTVILVSTSSILVHYWLYSTIIVVKDSGRVIQTTVVSGVQEDYKVTEKLNDILVPY